MIYGSVCSGIEAASAAWHPLGWTPSFFSEIDAFPRAVLAHRFPEVPLHGDFTTIQDGDYRPIDLLVGGTPCQSFSIAGLRGGLDDDRGNLALEYLRLADRLRPRWLVWENVPGVLSSNGGRDFGSILGGMVQLGYGFAYRVLDAQFFGVAQRRRRVFVVGHLGDWRPAAAVLFERQSLRGDAPPSRTAGKGTSADVAPSLVASGRGVERTGDTRGQDPLVAVAFGGNNTAGAIDVATARVACNSPHGRLDFESETFLVEPVAFSIMSMNSGKDYKARETDIAQLVMTSPVGGNQGGDYVVQPFAIQERAICENPNAGPDGAGFRADGAAYTLEARTVPQAVAFDLAQITSAANRTRVEPELPASTLSKESRMHVALCATGEVFHTLRADGHDGSEDGSGQGSGAVVIGTPLYECKACGESFADPYATGVGGLAPAECPRCGEERGVVQAFDWQSGGDCRGLDPQDTAQLQRCQTPAVVGPHLQVRRLTPTECERLQGFPDGWTAIPYRGKPASDGPRYKALGNSMAVPVMAWIGRRIAAVENLHLNQRVA